MAVSRFVRLCLAFTVASLFCFQLTSSADAQENAEVISFKILHTPITSAVPNEKIKIQAEILDSKNVAYVAVKYRVVGQERYDTLFMKKQRGDSFVTYIPATRVVPPGVEYYVFVMDVVGTSHVLFRDKDSPQMISVRSLEDTTFEGEETGAFGEAFGLGLQEEFALFAAEDVVITASKREQKLNEAPAAITVITEEDIAASGAQSIAELLRIVPGFDVWSASNSYEIIGARGRTDESSNLVLVLVDGREQNLELFGIAFLQEMPVNLCDIKRIEVIRGPGSSLYGANAFSAVVNIITKEPDEAKGYYFTYMGGQIRTHQMFGSAAGVVDDIGFLVSGSVREATKFSDRLEDELSQRIVRTAVTYKIAEDMRVKLDSGSVTGKVETYSTIGELNADGQLHYAQLNYNWSDLTFKYYWNGFNLYLSSNDPIFSAFLPNISGYGNMHDFELQYVWAPVDWNSLTVGGNYRINDFFSEVMSPQFSSETMAGAYIQEEIKPIDDVTLILGGRGDYNSITKPAFSPRLALLWTFIEDHTLRLNGSQAFRKPSFYEAQLHISTLDELGVEISNDNLENEEITAFEMGYAGKFGDRVRLNLDLYHNTYSKIIDWESKEASFSNSKKESYAYGFELSTRMIFADWFDALANYSYMREEDEDGERLKGRPMNKANVGLHFHFDFGLLFTALAHYVGPYEGYLVDPLQGNMLLPYSVTQELGDYTVLNLKLGQRLWSDRIEIGLSVFNALYDKDNAVRQFPGLDHIDVDGESGPAEAENYGGEPLYRRILGYVTLRF